MTSTAVAVTFGLLTALANAAAVMMQHVASSAGGRRGWPWVRQVVRHPLWLLGWVAMAGSLVFQAVALHAGPMSLVQPLLVGELVIALVLRRLWRRQRLSRPAWTSAAVTTLALVTVLVVVDPHGVARTPTRVAWVTTIVASAISVLVLVALARGAGPVRRAASFATATAVLWALEATFIKSATDVLVAGGVGALLTSWPLYALVVAGLGGLTTEQLALREGPLRVSQPLIVIVDPLVSVLYGLGLFHERLASSGGALLVAGLGVVAMSVGVVVMTSSVPESLVPEVLPAPPSGD
ncbi:MAG: DMT family transporter [Acidimicrobiales bacterium]